MMFPKSSTAALTMSSVVTRARDVERAMPTDLLGPPWAVQRLLAARW
jgi:hypothetical protein